MPMIRDGDDIVGRGDGQIGGAAKFDIRIGFWRASLLGIENDQAFLPRSVVDSNQTFAIIEPFEEAVAHAIRLAVLNDWPLPVAHRESLAARGQGDRVALGMQAVRIQIEAGGDESPAALGAQAGEEYRNALCRICGGIEQVEIAAGMIDYALPVGGEIAGIEIVMV